MKVPVSVPRHSFDKCFFEQSVLYVKIQIIFVIWMLIKKEKKKKLISAVCIKWNENCAKKYMCDNDS